MRKFGSVSELVNTLKPEHPVYCIRPNSIKKSVEFFKNNFPGKVLYAVKTNPNEKVIKIIINNGIKNFDVASINEVKLIRKIDSKVKIYFMHTIKSEKVLKKHILIIMSEILLWILKRSFQKFLSQQKMQKI